MVSNVNMSIVKGCTYSSQLRHAFYYIYHLEYMVRGLGCKDCFDRGFSKFILISVGSAGDWTKILVCEA